MRIVRRRAHRLRSSNEGSTKVTEAHVIMISICIAIKNRSRVVLEDRELRLFPNCVASIVESVNASSSFELIVADWDSDDWPLSEWLADAASPIPVRIVRMTGGFS